MLISSSVNDEQPSNIEDISVTFFVLKLIVSSSPLIWLTEANSFLIPYEPNTITNDEIKTINTITPIDISALLVLIFLIIVYIPTPIITNNTGINNNVMLKFLPSNTDKILAPTFWLLFDSGWDVIISSPKSLL